MSFVVKCDLVKNESGVFPRTSLDEGESATLLLPEGEVVTNEQVEEFDIAEFVCKKEDLPYEVKALYFPDVDELVLNGVVYVVSVETVEEKKPEATKPAEPASSAPEKKDDK